MSFVWRNFPQDNVSAFYEEAPGGGDTRDINSLRNRPALDPESWFASVFWHSALDNLSVLSDDTVAISHALVAGGTGSSSPGGGTFGSGNSPTSDALSYMRGTADFLLKTHSLGVLPLVFVIRGSDVLFPGSVVQTDTGGRARFVSAYVTTTEVRLSEWSTVSTSALAAASISYRVIVFRPPPTPSGNYLFRFDPTTGVVSMARSVWRNDRRYAQVVAGGSPFGITKGRTGDAANGASRLISPGGSVVNSVPSGAKHKMTVGYRANGASVTYDPGYGSASREYDGSFAAQPTVQLQVP